MAFRQIGIPARKVIDRIESERAAVKVAQGIAANRSGEESDGSPTLIADAPARSGSGKGKDRRPKPPASQQGDVKQTKRSGPEGFTHRERMPPVLRVIDGKCEPTHTPRALPTRRVGSHLQLVWSEGHAPAPRMAAAMRRAKILTS